MLYIFITFLAIGSGFTSADDEICSEDMDSVCFGRKASKFPVTAEDLEKACGLVIKGLQCGIDYGERCHSNPNLLPDGYIILETMHEICNPSSMLHIAVVNNLQCFDDNKMTMTHECVQVEPLEETVLEKHAAELLKEGFEVENNIIDEDPYFCLRILNEISCMALVMERECGKIAMSALVEIFQKLARPLSDDCADHISKMLPSVIRMKRLENDIEQALKRRKK